MHFRVAILYQSSRYWKEDSNKELKRSESATVKSSGHCSIIGSCLCQKHKISSCYGIKNANNVSKYDSQSEENEPERN